MKGEVVWRSSASDVVRRLLICRRQNTGELEVINNRGFETYFKQRLPSYNTHAVDR